MPTLGLSSVGSGLVGDSIGRVWRIGRKQRWRLHVSDSAAVAVRVGDGASFGDGAFFGVRVGDGVVRSCQSANAWATVSETALTGLRSATESECH